MARDRRFMGVIVLGEIVRAGVNTIRADATVGISDEHSALPIDGRVDEVEQIAIVRLVTANYRAGIADRSALHWIVRCRIHGRPRLAAVVSRRHIDVPDTLKSRSR